MPIDKENEERAIERIHHEREKRKRQRMHISGKCVFELQKLMSKSSGRRITKLINKKKK